MNILVVHEVSYAKKVVYEYQEFAEHLAMRGHRVTVIDYDETGDSNFRERSITRTGIASVTVWNTPYLNFPLVKYLSGRLNYPHLLKRAILENRVDVVILYSVFINGTITLAMCKDHGIPVVYRVLDAYHKLRQNRWISDLLKRGERRIYRNSDVVCLTNDKMAAYVDSVAQEPVADRLLVLNHGVDIAKFKPMPRDITLCNEHGILDEDRIALFVGTLYPFCGVDKVLENFHNILQAVPTAKLVIVGDGPLMSVIQQIVLNKHLQSHVVIAGVRPFVEVPRWLSIADVAFNSFELNEITRDIVPIKMLQYLAAGLPVISAPIPDVMRLFPEASSGVRYWNIGDAEGFTRLIGQTLSDRAACVSLGRAGRLAIEDAYSLDDTIDSLETILVGLARANASQTKTALDIT